MHNGLNHIFIDKWIVIRGPTAVLGKIWIFGGLEFEFAPNPNGGFYDFTFIATHIVIVGGRLVVGWEETPFQGTMNFVLKGNHLTPDLPLSRGLNLGAKAIGEASGRETRLLYLLDNVKNVRDSALYVNTECKMSLFYGALLYNAEYLITLIRVTEAEYGEH